jgi:dipeptidase E
MHGRGYLDHVAPEIKDFVEHRISASFIPYALHDRRAYAAQIEQHLKRMGLECTSVHDTSNAARAIEQSEIIFVGGGNTFRLLHDLQVNQLIEPIRRAIRAGALYIGSSAGSIVACPTLKTTKDMPVTQPLSFRALGLVHFQISPHYLDPDSASTHMGETQEQRILQFLEENTESVVGLREGSFLRIENDAVLLKGPNPARIFRSGFPPVEAVPGTDLRPLLGSNPSPTGLTT